MIKNGAKTLEYDLAFHNHTKAIIVTDECTNAAALRTLFADANATLENLNERLTAIRAEVENVPATAERAAHVVATYYLESLENAKGSHALALAKALKDANGTPSLIGFTVPTPITEVIRFACRQPAATTATTTGVA
jgi:hypothetical protein